MSIPDCQIEAPDNPSRCNLCNEPVAEDGYCEECAETTALDGGPDPDEDYEARREDPSYWENP